MTKITPNTEDDEWCREETCRYRHWRSGSMPTHQRGSDCPPSTTAAAVTPNPSFTCNERGHRGCQTIDGQRWHHPVVTPNGEQAARADEQAILDRHLEEAIRQSKAEALEGAADSLYGDSQQAKVFRGWLRVRAASYRAATTEQENRP